MLIAGRILRRMSGLWNSRVPPGVFLFRTSPDPIPQSGLGPAEA